MFPTTTVFSLHQEYNESISELNFYKREINTFEQRLAQRVKQSEPVDVRANLEQIQNQFILEKEVIDELIHKLHRSEKKLAGFVKEVSGLGLENIDMEDHPNLREDMHTFRKIYFDLKNRFKKFESVYR
jgi:Tfp pilus assembly protein PilO